ncbi:hypothetical protein DSCO28_24800 [Desulfosarcina ovata subsp. sediminis]|uniref:Hemolysin n=1 Tax=Desulfosarcina ovata subsp. sediminis TaxID=885957 RepID=A0A5K7ZKL6_9BACT|nr:hemolysin family protein [Desulfosarcina ovata]BBO81914.1 hypothetical protein DSCO28_24800 [Desulfosarcina ovata subsp. sediminis]
MSDDPQSRTGGGRMAILAGILMGAACAVAPVILLVSPAVAIPVGSGGTVAQATSADTLLLIAYVSLALGVSFLCSVAEAVLLSVTPAYIESLKFRRPERATLLKRLKQDNVDQSLAAILTLNTIAHTVGAIGAGAKATAVFGSAWFGLFSAVMTLMILFLSEIIPKTIGAVYWTKLAGLVALFVRGMIVLLYPMVWISERLTRLVAGDNPVHVFSREEFLAMVRVGEQSGQLQNKESRIIRNLFRFDSLNIADIMTPRTVISAFPDTMAMAVATDRMAKSPFSRFPIYRKDIDDVSGFVLKDDVLVLSAKGRGEEPLLSARRDILAVPETLRPSILLETFLKDRQHIALIVDEYGGTEGIVTLEDLVETLMGMEIVDERDTVEDMRALARKRWAARARVLGVEIEK